MSGRTDRLASVNIIAWEECCHSTSKDIVPVSELVEPSPEFSGPLPPQENKKRQKARGNR
jgi:hypothetical protein